MTYVAGADDAHVLPVKEPRTFRFTIAACRNLPGEFGAWDAVYNRLRRWVHSGALQRLFESLTAEPQFGEVRRVLVDSTLVRAHRHAAGARRKKKRLAPGAAQWPKVWAAAEAG